MANSEQHPAQTTVPSTRDHIHSEDASAPSGQAGQGTACWEFPGKRYQVVGEIGRGGMGIVLRAYDKSLGRSLAIKLLLQPAGSRSGDERRLLEEARITGQLQHPGIPPVHEIGRLADGRPFFSMKLIEGRTLADLVAERPSPHVDLARFLKIFEQVAQTLAYAHARGVIHRDLKPANIMVGAFGEVQVMDWGLAKRLRGEEGAGEVPVPSRAASPPTVTLPAGEIDRHSDTPEPPPETTAATLPATPASNSDPLTQAGQILGTPAFMSPEQARGAIESLDERSDVFGLGAILCVLLTGEPPYGGKDRSSVFRRAAEADLGDTRERLRGCGADNELIQLCELCLRADRTVRPAHAGIVAQGISAYLVSVQERLEQTRLERAAVEVRAREERKRRRLAVGLACAVVVLVLGGALVGLWYAGEKARREADSAARRDYLQTEVRAAVDEADRRRRQLHQRLRNEVQAAQLLSDPKQWQRLLDAAQDACKRAEVLAGGDRDMLSADLSERLATLTAQLEADERDRRSVFELDRIRLESSGVLGGRVRIEPAAPRLAQVFRAAGYDLEKDPPSEVGERLKLSPIRLPLVAGLDFWALASSDAKVRQRLLEAACVADPNPWRDRFRRTEVWQDRSMLAGLVAAVNCADQSPQLLVALGQSFRSAGGDAAAFFRRALIHHPHDFWLHFELGISSNKPVEQAGAFRAALALRPETAVAYHNLGVVLQGERLIDEAGACYHRAAALDSKQVGALNNLGLLLEEQHKPAEASACYRRAIDNDPRYVAARLNLGSLLQAQGELAEAVSWYRSALDIDSDNVAGLNNLGTALRQQDKLDEAIVCFQRAIKINPKHAMAWCNLGHVLRQQEKYKEALPILRRGHELGSKERGWTHPSAFWVLETLQWIGLDDKLAAVARGGSPGGARAQLALAEFCLANKKRYAAAARFYAGAFAAEPKLADDLVSQRRYNAACAAVRAAHGEDKDASNAEPAERRRLRNQALEWLTADLKAWTARLEENPRRHAAAVAKTLRHWQEDGDLSSVRDDKALALLPLEEQSAWRRFWAGVADVQTRAGKGTR